MFFRLKTQSTPRATSASHTATSTMDNATAITRGGQTVAHQLRMLAQVSKFIGQLTVGVCVLAHGMWVIGHMRMAQWHVLWAWCLAQWNTVLIGANAAQVFVEADGVRVSVLSADVLHHPVVHATRERFIHLVLSGFVVDAIVGAITIGAISIWFVRRGFAHSQHHFIRGDRLVDSAVLATHLRRAHHASDLTLGDVPLVKDAERQHILIHGTVGSGKSMAIKQLLTQLRRRGERAIIYDKGCDFMRLFYRPDTDVLLNPLDARSVHWNVWSDCATPADFDTLAEALMPQPAGGHDPFWVKAAQTIFACTAYQLLQTGETRTRTLLQYLLAEDLQPLQALLTGTVAEALVSSKVEKTALNVKSVLASYIKALDYLRDDTQPHFSIKRWMADDNHAGAPWLFITSQGDQHETLKPLISMWLNTAANRLLSLTPDPTRRVWLIVDELASLQRLPYLSAAMAEARKFGGCLVVGIQSIAQLRKLYGHDGANEIAGLCNTRLFLRATEPSSQQWVSDQLGRYEQRETSENISYGAHSIRDGVSLGQHTVARQLVLPSEIGQLPDLTGFLISKGDHPIARVTLPLCTLPERQAGFVPSARISTGSGSDARPTAVASGEVADALTDDVTLAPFDLDVLAR